MLLHKNGITWMISQCEQLKLLVQRYDRFNRIFFESLSNQMTPDFNNFKSSIAEIVKEHNRTSLMIMYSDADNVVKHLVDGERHFHDFIRELMDTKVEKESQKVEAIATNINDEKRKIIESSHALLKSILAIIEEFKKLNKSNSEFKHYDVQVLRRSIEEGLNSLFVIRNSSEKIVSETQSLKMYSESELSAMKRINEEAKKTHWVYANIESWFKTS
jgi:hypothetical protein